MIRNTDGQIVLSTSDEQRLNHLIIWSRQFIRDRGVYQSLDATRFVQEWNDLQDAKQKERDNAV